MTDEIIKEDEVAKPKVSIEDLPFHVLRTKLKEKDIKFKAQDKKADLIKMLKSGKTIHEPKPKTQAPKLSDSKSKSSLPIVPDEIKADLEALAQKGLEWTITENPGLIHFRRGGLSSCANLDQSAKNILKTARACFAGSAPPETGYTNDMI